MNDFPAAALNTCLFTIHFIFRWQKLLKRYRQAYGNCLKDIGKPEQAVLKGIGKPLNSY